MNHHHDRYILTRELRSIYKTQEDLSRRLAASHMAGTVAQVDGNRVRVKLRDDGAGGKPFLSPWVQAQEAAGATGTHFPIHVGDPMRLFSPQGELGPQSIAIRDSYTQSAPSPAGSPDDLAIAYDGCAIRIVGGEIILDGPLTVKGRAIFEEGVAIEGEALTHKGTNVGSDHRHRGVDRGDALTDEPV